ncbi:MAG: alpha-L-fucosidase [Planctomycetota bacterium]
MSYDPYIREMMLREAKEAGEVHVEPTPAQQAWLDLQFGLFVHFGINTFNDTEWSDGTLGAASFNPTEFDPEQWCKAAAAAGVGYVLLVTKHHDGFCLWPSDYTDYTVAASPLGEDVLGAVVESARRHGLKVGFYYSLWDRHQPGYENDRSYAIFMKKQLAELLTRYGEIVEIWFDGGWKKGGVDYQDPERWHWREIYEHIKSIQPGCLTCSNGTSKRWGELIMYPQDFRIGEKKLPPEDDKKIWYCGGIGDYLPYEMCHTLSKGGTGTGMFASGKWFWHEDDTTVQDPQWVVDTLNTCNQRGANFVINAGPDTRGKLRDLDVQCLEEVGRLRGK